jgi:hypothetical protein
VATTQRGGGGTGTPVVVPSGQRVWLSGLATSRHLLSVCSLTRRQDSSSCRLPFPFPFPELPTGTRGLVCKPGRRAAGAFITSASGAPDRSAGICTETHGVLRLSCVLRGLCRRSR